MTPDEPADQTPAETPTPPAAHAATVSAEETPGASAAGPPARHRRRRRRRRGPSRPASEAAAADTSAEPQSEGGVTVEAAPAPRPLGENTLRLRTRPPRRRRRPPAAKPTGEGSDGVAPVDEAADSESAAAPAAPEDTAGAPTQGPRLGPDGQPLRRRRRRRRPPQLGGAGEQAPDVPAKEAAARPARDPNRPPRRRTRRSAGDQPAGDGPSAARPSRDRRTAGEHAPREGDRRRDRGDRRDSRDSRERRGRGGRDDRPRPVERKLYAIDSVVDRGFEDVDEEAGTRRVHWTIVKRTVADQITRKPMSQNYVLQRDGVDSEFPSLGAARDAVNKKIVHPEKLTLSKAEHAAQKSGR